MKRIFPAIILAAALIFLVAALGLDLMSVIFILLALVAHLSYTIYLSRKELREFRENLEDKEASEIKVALQSYSYTGELNEICKIIEAIIDSKNTMGQKYNASIENQNLMITNISHDFRTPLTSIMGYIDVYERTRDEKYLEIIKKKAEELKELIDGFYDFSRLVSKSYKIDKRVFNLDDFIKEEIVNYYDYYIAKGQMIDVELDRVRCFQDEKNLKIVVDNLISNMMKYSEGADKIELKLKDGYFELKFSNLAQIETDDSIDRVFERNYTIDKSKNDASSGLGLNIVENLCELMGLNVSVEYKDDVFTITITGKALNK
ncbi:MAG: HAMP domain-containing sensor histidine kinase [Eubacteriales bacterium]|uniref:sensor histidine kinase n=1 Tax=Fenollaria sp. TaxID=1965292 RepID=UPI002A761426|nr:HAMP domain-containing sensor histidine kinase [Fenollaria sp.]MDD7339336.1 HAMP domain-containing sensor histidine kinase [Eubacteriales bacterium]MDY3106150.1 HAMP domain-containing sensor histidine kinase [Fenollaria sp.]